MSEELSVPLTYSSSDTATNAGNGKNGALVAPTTDGQRVTPPPTDELPAAQMQSKQMQYVTPSPASPTASSSLLGRVDGWMQWESYVHQSRIVTSCRMSSRSFLIWKALTWTWSFAIYIMCLAESDPNPGKFFVFLTNWNQSAILFYLSASFYVCLRHHLGRPVQLKIDVAPLHGMRKGETYASSSSPDVGVAHEKDPHDHEIHSDYVAPSWLLKVCYVGMEHAFSWTCLVVLVYWTTEFPVFLDRSPTSYDVFSTVCAHAITGVIISVDLALNRIEFIWGHVLYTLALSAVYLVVNGVYCAIVGGFIYQILKWNSVVSAIAIIGACCFLLATYAFGHWICIIRNRRTGNRAPTPTQPLWCKPCPLNLC